MWAALTAGKPWVAEFTNRRKDGSLFLEVSHISPVFGADGAIESYVTVKHDVSREREIEGRSTELARQRVMISETLSALPTAHSPESAARLVAEQLVTLEAVSAVAVIAFEHDSAALPLAVATAKGIPWPLRRLPVRVARPLRTRAAEGPWIQRWANRPGRTYNDLLVVTGAVAIAWVPIVVDGSVSGLIMAVSSRRDAPDVLAGHLPALLEFANLSGTLVGASLGERTTRGALRTSIRHAISRRAMTPVFQPIVGLATMEVVGYEALTRLDSGQRPDAFFAGAWSVSLGPEAELAALGLALAESAWLPAGRWLSVNLAPGTVTTHQADLLMLRASDRPIVIEVTEHELVPDYPGLRHAARGLGNNVLVAVDGVGSGVANFAHIVELQPDFVELDIQLVRGINQDAARQALVVGLRHFARSVGCRLIAEGIETDAELETLRSLGVELGQGYLLGRPAPVDAWRALAAATDDPSPAGERP